MLTQYGRNKKEIQNEMILHLVATIIGIIVLLAIYYLLTTITFGQHDTGTHLITWRLSSFGCNVLSVIIILNITAAIVSISVKLAYFQNENAVNNR